MGGGGGGVGGLGSSGAAASAASADVKQAFAVLLLAACDEQQFQFCASHLSFSFTWRPMGSQC